jgi:exodeoxyribonuclease VII large subunit
MQEDQMQLVTADVPKDVTSEPAKEATPDVAAEALSVSDYASQLGSALRKVGGAVLEGEVQEPSTPGRSGMFFFDLTDGKSVLSCKVFRHAAKRLKHRPKHGDLVRVTVDRPDLHNGNLNLVVSAVELAGVGALLRKREELLKRLTAEGLTDPDRWKPRPWLPKAVGVIAGRDSKGMTDVIRALTERFSPVSIASCPALVQGLKAPRDLIDALAYLEQDRRVEVIILARGGGSVQDLVAFDDEGLCKAVFACSTPVIAAVGHTDNVPVVNHVTWSATTPSRAPELAVPAASELRLQLSSARQALTVVPDTLSADTDRVGVCAEKIEVTTRLEGKAGTVREVGLGLGRAEERMFGTRERGLEHMRAMLGKIPFRLPTAERLAESRTRLDAAVRSLFHDCAADLERQRENLFGPALRGLADLRSRVEEQRGRIVAGTRRELADHERDYGRATVRLARETQQSVERDLDAYRRELERRQQALAGPCSQIFSRLEEEIEGGGGRIGAGTRRELADHERDYRRAAGQLARETRQLVERDLDAYRREVQRLEEKMGVGIEGRFRLARRDSGHLAAVIKAHDQRSRGWVLPQDEVGALIKFPPGVPSGQRFSLNFRDGRQWVVADSIELEEGSR